MDHLYVARTVSDRAWQAVDDEARTRLVPYLGARKLIDFEGPPAGSTRPPTWGGREPSPRACRKASGPSSGGCCPSSSCGRRSPSPARELEDIDRGAADPDLSDLERAARRIALAENQAVFHGFAAGGIRGIVEASRLGDPPRRLRRTRPPSPRP